MRGAMLCLMQSGVSDYITPRAEELGDDSSGAELAAQAGSISSIPRTHIKKKRQGSPASRLHSVAVNEAGPQASESRLIHKLQANKKDKKISEV